MTRALRILQWVSWVVLIYGIVGSVKLMVKGYTVYGAILLLLNSIVLIYSITQHVKNNRQRKEWLQLEEHMKLLRGRYERKVD